MKYILENKKEFARLEKQSATELFDFKRELSGISVPEGGKVLDAGCGSGIVARYLAQTYPNAEIIGADQSSDRIEQAKGAAKDFNNLSFQTEDITQLSFGTGTLDVILCRFVLEHLNPENIQRALCEMHRCLKPGGKLYLIDIDGYLYNLYPQSPLVTEFLAQLTKRGTIDLHVGRKLPAYVAKFPYENIRWEIETLQIRGGAREIEMELIRERFQLLQPTLVSLMGTPTKAEQFVTEYLGALTHSETVLFYNKFIVTAQKSALRLISPERKMK
jgi:ubiquinone/menaquinone biosynthesis C-methylase UbiE